MKTHVVFRSERFPPYGGEEKEINPGRYGRRLAEFLARGLRAKGFDACDLIAEDWGWWIKITNDRFNLWIGGGNYEEYPDGFLCFIDSRPTIRKLIVLKPDFTEIFAALQLAVDELLSENGHVHNKQWWTAEEFSRLAQGGDV